MAATKPTLTYWDIRGLGEPIRYLLKYAGVDFVDKRILYANKDQWLAQKYNLGLDFPNLPYWVDKDIKITQSVAILRYLGRKYGLMAVGDRALARQDMAEQQLEDMKSGLYSAILGDDWEARRPKYITDTLVPQLDLMVKFLGTQEWLTSGQLSSVDFMAYETFDWFKLFTPETVAKYPTIGQYLARFEALPAIKDYQSSQQYKSWPLFGSDWGAKWGS